MLEFLAGLLDTARAWLPEIILFGRDVTLYVWGAVPVVVAWAGFLASVRTLTDPTPQSKTDADAAHREQMAAAKAVDRAVAQVGEASRGRDEALGTKVETAASALAERVDEGNAEILAAIESLRQTQAGEGERPAMAPDDFAEAYLAMLNDERGAFAPVREEARAALAAMQAGRTDEAKIEFDRVIGALDRSLAQRAEMRAQVAREDAADYRRLGELAFDRAPSKALAAYREAVRLDGGDFSSWIYLARLERSHAGDLQAARAAAERALEVAGEARERSVAFFEIADFAVSNGSLSEARENFENGTQIMRALSAADPSSAAARRDVSVSLEKLGNVAVAEGDLGAAKAAYGEGLEIRRALSAADPSSAAARRDVSVSLEKLGNVAVAEGDLGAAKAAYGEGLEIRRALSAADPSSAAARRDVSVSLEKLGNVAVAEGDLGAAKAAYGEGLEIRRALSAADPSSAAARRDVSVSLTKLGDVAVAEGDLGAAKAAYGEGLETLRALSAADPSSAAARRDVWVSLWRMAKLGDMGVSWDEVANELEAQDRAGTLFEPDRKFLEEAQRRAGR